MLGARNQSVTAEYRRVRQTRGPSVRGGEAIESFVVDENSSPMPGETKRRKRMRRLLFLLLGPLAAALASIVLVASPAAADSPHFIFATNSIDTSTGALVTSFKDAGLGTGTTSIAITLSATASATYQCYNKAGNKPEGVPKSFGPTALATPPTPFPVSHGQTTNSLSLGPLGPGTFGCPSGQILFLDGVTYSHTVVADATGNSADATPDPISATLHIKV